MASHGFAFLRILNISGYFPSFWLEVQTNPISYLGKQVGKKRGAGQKALLGYRFCLF